MQPEVHIYCVHTQFVVYVCNLFCTYAIHCVLMQFVVYVCNLLCTYAIHCVCMQFIVYVCNLLAETSTELPFGTNSYHIL